MSLFSQNIYGSEKLSILTLNIQCFKNNWKFRLAHILSPIIKNGVDIVSFQEVCKSKEQNQIEFIAKFLKKHGYDLKSLAYQFTHKAWDKYDEDLLIFSKHKAQKIKRGFLPWSPLQRAYVALKINDVWYVNIHLEHKKEYYKYRRDQIHFLVKEFENTDHVFMGDYNSSPQTQEQNELWNKKYKPYFPGPSHLGNDGNAVRTIDGFWFNYSFRKKLSNIRAKLVYTKKVNNQHLSDHLGVFSIINF